MKTGHCQLHKDFCRYSSKKKKTCLNHRLITAIEVCQLVARRRIQSTDTGPYMPTQKGPTIIVLVMCIFRSQNQLPSQPEIQTTTSELGIYEFFCVSKMHLHAAQHVYNTWGAPFSPLYHIGSGETLRIGFVSSYTINLRKAIVQLTHSTGRKSAVLWSEEYYPKATALHGRCLDSSNLA